MLLPLHAYYSPSEKGTTNAHAGTVPASNSASAASGVRAIPLCGGAIRRKFALRRRDLGRDGFGLYVKFLVL